MVYLRKIIKENRIKLLHNKSIELVAYLAITSPNELQQTEFELMPDEKIALNGYKHEIVDPENIASIISKPPIKGIDATTNIYKLAGLYLASDVMIKDKLLEKYSSSDLKQKYFLSKIEPSLIENLKKDIVIESSSQPTSVLIKQILELENVNETDLDIALQKTLKSDIDIQSQILLEDLEASLLKIKYINKNAEEIIRDILNNFSNAIQKIIKNRRKDHPDFNVKDEYDVQDILYVVLKSIFPLLKDEDPIPKNGGSSTKIDLILRNEKILIEVKMLGINDKNEINFIKQLKEDIESYHECQWLGKLFCFIYDPYKKTKDKANFQELNGNRTKASHNFNVEMIIAN